MAKPIKIFVFPTHCEQGKTPGVDYVRMVLPMRELKKDPRFEVTIFDGAMDKARNLDWRDIAEEYDILYLNYLTLPWDFALIGMLFRKFKKKIVFDLDDLIWEIQEDNSSYNTYKPGSDGRAVVTDIIREADYVTCTNRFLKNGIAAYTQKALDAIEIFPNYIDLSLYSWHVKPPERYQVKIGYFGSSSHFNDLVDAPFVQGLSRLMEEYPNVELVTVGAMIQSFKKKFGMRYFNDFGHQDIYTWVKMFPEKLGDVDIFAVPLVDTTYCRAKSSIKALEMGSTKRPIVFQSIRQYNELIIDGRNGYLASTAKEWYEKLKHLIDRPDERVRVAENLYKTIENDWTIQNPKNIGRYARFFEKVMNV